MTRRSELALLVAIIVVTLVRVAATHHVFAAVIDEPVHIAAGYDWVVRHSNAFDPVHPPLARLVSALPLAHFPPPVDRSLIGAGNDLLYARGHYVHNLALARRGNLLFLLVALWCVWWWASRAFSRGTALLAVAFLGSMPPILGHAGVVTTDMAVAATLPLALIAFDLWLERRDAKRALLLGLAIGAGLLSKFSFVAFFPVCAAALLVARVRTLRSARGLATLLLAIAIGALTLWAGYFFDVDTIAHAHPDSAVAKFANVRVPAPLYWAGLRVVKIHDELGHLSFLLGRYSQNGFWYYFPVVFFFKTPIPFLVLMVAGIIAIVRARRGLELVLMPLALMLFVLTSHINIGIRHILPIYPPLCVVAAAGAVALWRNAKGRVAAALLMAWLFAGVALAHPDYLAWFNEFAGRHPERIATDSNLDWGQDILRLGRAARRHHIERGTVLVVATGNIMAHGYPAHDQLMPFKRTTGWIAVSETALTLDDATPKGGYDWLVNGRPYERIGKTIRLYFVRGQSAGGRAQMVPSREHHLRPAPSALRPASMPGRAPPAERGIKRRRRHHARRQAVGGPRKLRDAGHRGVVAFEEERVALSRLEVDRARRCAAARARVDHRAAVDAEYGGAAGLEEERVVARDRRGDGPGEIDPRVEALDHVALRVRVRRGEARAGDVGELHALVVVDGRSSASRPWAQSAFQTM